MATTKTYKIVESRRGRETTISGDLPYLIDYFSYTLSCGASYQHEKGNKQINQNPTTLRSLVSNLNNAKNNSAANGCGSSHYRVG